MIFRIETMATSCQHFNDARRAFAAVLLLACASALCGCDRREVLAPVEGRVTLAGEPVKQGYVIFRNDAKGVHTMAEIDERGEYRVSMAGRFGLPLGDYQVYLSPPVPDVPFGPAKAPPKPSEVAKFPDKYLQPETSGLQFSVEDAKAKRLDIDMQP